MAMEEVPACHDLNMDRDNVEGRYDEQMGTIRQVTLWVNPIDPITQKASEPIEYTFWAIFPDNHPDKIFEPCNLPEMQRIPNRRVSFSGHGLYENPNTYNLEGITPFNLTEISDGIEGPSSHDEDC